MRILKDGKLNCLSPKEPSKELYHNGSHHVYFSHHVCLMILSNCTTRTAGILFVHWIVRGKGQNEKGCLNRKQESGRWLVHSGGVQLLPLGGDQIWSDFDQP